MTPRAIAIDPGFAALKDRVIARTGHHYYADKDDQLAERVAQRMTALGIVSVGRYVERLDDPAAGSREWERIESAVTINETFFFRFAEQFTALHETILPRLIAARAGDKRLRIWSVGCSTGAEPYSIAILLHRLLGTRLADWRIAIVGTDIDGDALATAREALFGRWALRTMEADERTALFVAEGERFRLKPEYRAMVRFERHNMMTLLDAAPAPALEWSDHDLILCRNVLIYFRQDVATAMVGALAQRLRPDGYLLVGHAEPNPGFDTVAVPVDAGGVLAYRAAGTVVAAKPVVAVVAEPVVVPRKPKPVVRRVIATAPPVEPPVAEDALAAVRSLLATGDAQAAVRMAGMAHPRDPVGHYLAALGADALGQRAAAEQGYRRALYLDGGFAMAHYLLGRLLLSDGRGQDARRSLANAARAAGGLPPDHALVEGEGMTAGDLIAAVRHALAVAA